MSNSVIKSYRQILEEDKEDNISSEDGYLGGDSADKPIIKSYRVTDKPVIKSYRAEKKDETLSLTPPSETSVNVAGAETIDDLLTDDNFAVVSQYMDDRYSMNTDKYDRKEIVDAFVNHMRKFNFGQSVTTASELAFLNSAKDRTKYSAGQAYKLFDNMKGAFSEDYDALQKADAVYDYGRALIVDPLNIVSLGVGKLLTGGATRAAAVAAKEGVKQMVLKELGENALKGTLTAAQKAKMKQIERRVIGQVIKGEAVEGVAAGEFNKQMRRKAVNEILATTAFDTGASVTIDAVYQTALQKADVQTEYNAFQGGLSAAGGLFGGGLAYGLSRLSSAKGTQEGLPLAMHYYDNAVQAEENALRIAKKQRIASNKEALAKLDKSKLKEVLKKEATAAERWADKVLRGDTLRRTADDISDPRRDTFLGAFFHGAADGSFRGIRDILAEFDIRLANTDESETFKNFTDFLTETIKELPKEALPEIERLHKATLQRLPEFEGRNVNQSLDIISSMSSEWGRYGQTLSKLSQALKLRPEQSAADKLNATAIEELDAVPQGVREKLTEAQNGLQRNLIRMLVTHPGTTALNVIGWTNATTMQSAGDILRGALYAGRSLGSLMLLQTTSSKDFANKAKLMLTLQRQKITNLVNPFGTSQAMLDFLAANPKAQKEMFRYMSGGVELDQVYRDLGVQLDELEKPGTFEKIMDFAQTMYGVKAQDVFTKSQEFMYAIDKQIRLKYGKTYSEFLKDPLLYKNLRADDWAEIQAVAVEDALRNVYAKSYGKDPKGMLSYAARVIEDARKVPVIGAMIPFGQFFNNTLGHMFDHTGISLIHKYAAGTSRDPMELLTKSAVGLTLIGATASREYKNMEENLAWFEERQSDGSIVNRLYDFPYSFYKAIGRMAAHVWRDGEVPPEMTRDIINTFGPANLTRQLGESAKISFDMLVDAASGKDVVIREGLQKMVGDTASMYISGYTRPFDPINQIAAMTRGEDYKTVDRKEGREWLNKSARYVDQIYASLSGEDITEEEATSPLTQRRTPAPIGRIFGYREVPGQSHIQQMFNAVGRPQWRTEIKTYVPTVQNEMNRRIFHFLEYEAQAALQSERWQKGTTEEREKFVREIISMAKAKTLESLERSFSKDDKRTAKLFNLTKSGSTSEEKLNEALRDLGLEDKKVTELSEIELDFLISYLDVQDDRLKSIKKELQFSK